MVLFFLLAGSFVMSPMPNSEELPLLQIHAQFGQFLLALIVIRLGARFALHLQMRVTLC